MKLNLHYALSILAAFAFVACEPQEHIMPNTAPLQAITGLKDFELGTRIEQYQGQAKNCGALEYYSDLASVCIVEDTLMHLETEFWLYFADGELAIVEARAYPFITQSQISLIKSTLIEKYGKDEPGYGFLSWKADGRSMDFRFRGTNRGWIWVKDIALSDKFESYKSEDAKDDI